MSVLESKVSRPSKISMDQSRYFCPYDEMHVPPLRRSWCPCNSRKPHSAITHGLACVCWGPWPMSMWHITKQTSTKYRGWCLATPLRVHLTPMKTYKNQRCQNAFISNSTFRVPSVVLLCSIEIQVAKYKVTWLNGILLSCDATSTFPNFTRHTTHLQWWKTNVVLTMNSPLWQFPP